MNTCICNYAVVRFLPYRKTGEFVNIGVVVFSPRDGYFDFKFAREHWRRVHGFFPELVRGFYTSALDSLAEELESIREHIRSGAEGGNPVEIWRDLLRVREGVVHLAMPGVESADSPEKALEGLFADFVKRNFAQTKEYQETVMTRNLARALKRWKVRDHYHQQQVGNDQFRITLPFVLQERDRPFRAIKPLDLDRSDTTEIYQHGDRWLSNIRRLRKAGCAPDSLLFPVNLPGRPEPLAAANDLLAEFAALGADTIPMGEEERLRQWVAGEPAA
jgi:hypothetical protein